MNRFPKSLVHKCCHEDAYTERLGVRTFDAPKKLTSPKKLTEDAHTVFFVKALKKEGVLPKKLTLSGGFARVNRSIP